MNELLMTLSVLDTVLRNDVHVYSRCLQNMQNTGVRSERIRLNNENEGVWYYTTEMKIEGVCMRSWSCIMVQERPRPSVVVQLGAQPLEGL